jgi:WD40 repeat protein
LWLWFQVVKLGQGRSQNTKASLFSNEANKSLPRITAKQYACRDALLSSLIVAWSPVLSSSDRASCLSRDWCILAVGSKSGNVSFWKVCKPEYYTIDVGMVSREPMLVGVLQAHKSWVSAINLEVSSSTSSKSSLLLATGCSDGRWAKLCELFVNGYVHFLPLWPSHVLFTWLFISFRWYMTWQSDVCDYRI